LVAIAVDSAALIAFDIFVYSEALPLEVHAFQLSQHSIAAKVVAVVMDVF